MALQVGLSPPEHGADGLLQVIRQVVAFVLQRSTFAATCAGALNPKKEATDKQVFNLYCCFYPLYLGMPGARFSK